MRLASRSLLFLVGLTAVTAQAQISNFKHVVIIVQENRTPDNLFQGLCAAPYGACAVPPTSAAPYNIQTSNWLTKGGTIQPLPIALTNTYDLGHSYQSFYAMCDIVVGSPPTCQMDGASGINCIPNAGTTCPPNPQFNFVDNSTGILNPYLTLATQYGWANYMFQTNQGASFPAHQFIFGGTSAPSAADDANAVFAGANTFPQHAGAGCLGNGTVVALISPNPTPPPYGVEHSSVPPCFEHQTMADLVTDWRYYAAGASSVFTAPNAIDHICLPSGGVCTGWGRHVNAKNPAQVLTDMGNCHFPDLVWVTPAAVNSDHPGSNDGGGPSWVASVVNAVGNSTCTDKVNSGTLTYWQDTAIFITWDDWGGWYDHVPPVFQTGTIQDDYQFGFRVPLVVVSAYSTKAGYISNLQYDFGSILKGVEGIIGTGNLGFADARATNDLHDFFNFTQTPTKYKTIPAPLAGGFFTATADTEVAPPDTD